MIVKIIYGIAGVFPIMKYRIKIWLDPNGSEYSYIYDDMNFNFQFSCEPPEGKYARSKEILIMSEKMREFAEKENPNKLAVIDIYDYYSKRQYAKNYIYHHVEPKRWILNYVNDNNDNTWITVSFPYNEV